MKSQQSHLCQSDTHTCPFVWVAGHDSTKDIKWVHKNLVSKIDPPTGSWVLEEHDDWRKMGLTALGAGATMNIILGKLDVRASRKASDMDTDRPLLLRILIFYMKSYGSKWMNSTAKFDIVSEGQVVETTTLSGYHNQSTSEMYVKEMVIPLGLSSNPRQAQEEKRLELAVTLIGGTTFKVMGLLLCSS